MRAALIVGLVLVAASIVAADFTWTKCMSNDCSTNCRNITMPVDKCIDTSVGGMMATCHYEDMTTDMTKFSGLNCQGTGVAERVICSRCTSERYYECGGIFGHVGVYGKCNNDCSNCTKMGSAKINGGCTNLADGTSVVNHGLVRDNTAELTYFTEGTCRGAPSRRDILAENFCYHTYGGFTGKFSCHQQ